MRLRSSINEMKDLTETEQFLSSFSILLQIDSTKLLIL